MGDEKAWESYRLYVTLGLTKLEQQNTEILNELQTLKTELAVHKVKSGFWGALMGAIVALSVKMFGGGHS